MAKKKTASRGSSKASTRRRPAAPKTRKAAKKKGAKTKPPKRKKPFRTTPAPKNGSTRARPKIAARRPTRKAKTRHAPSKKGGKKPAPAKPAKPTKPTKMDEPEPRPPDERTENDPEGLDGVLLQPTDPEATSPSKSGDARRRRGTPATLDRPRRILPEAMPPLAASTVQPPAPARPVADSSAEPGSLAERFERLVADDPKSDPESLEPDDPDRD